MQKWGGNAALVKTLTTQVNDGALNIEFLHQVQNPEVRAIEIKKIADRSVNSDGVNITLEAEEYTTFNDANPGVDSFSLNRRTDASGGVYMQSVGKWGESYLEYEFELPVDDVYEIGVRGTGVSSGTNSFRISIDAGVDSVVQLNTDDSWGWKTITDANSGLGPYFLSAGSHTLRLKKREPNAKIDQLRISNTAGTSLPVASVSPSSLSFSNQDVGSVSNAQNITLTNSGNAPLNITAISTTGDFSESNGCGDVLLEGTSCQINVSFTPASAGNLTGALVVGSDDTNSPGQVSLSGSGNVLTPDPDVIFAHGFENDEPGTYTNASLRESWNTRSTNPGFLSGTTEIVKDLNNSGRDNVMSVSFVAGGIHFNRFVCCSGNQWRTPLTQKNELYLSYDVMFEPGFEFVLGGKLPGLFGGKLMTGGNIPTGFDGWSGRLMWKKDGTIINYMYHAAMPGKFGQNFKWKNANGVQSRFIPGKWHTVEVRYVINTPGVANGSVQAWLDGEQVLDTGKQFLFRNTDAFSIDGLVVTTFFGGATLPWASPKNQQVFFDNFKVSTQPITHSAGSGNAPVPGPPSAPGIPFYQNINSFAGQVQQLNIPSDNNAIGSVWNGNDLKDSPLENMERTAIILKADDYGRPFSESSELFFLQAQRYNAVASLGVITKHLKNNSFEVNERYRELNENGFEIVFHGHDHTLTSPTAEFLGVPLTSQRKAFAAGLEAARTYLGINLHSFSAPGNKIDENTGRAMSEFPEFVAWLFGRSRFTVPNSDIKIYPRKLNIEESVGNVSTATAFFSDYDVLMKSNSPPSVLTLQMHPRNYDAQDATRTENIFEGLAQRDEIRYTTPYAFWKWERDKKNIELRKTGEFTYILDMSAAKFDHRIELKGGN